MFPDRRLLVFGLVVVLLLIGILVYQFYPVAPTRESRPQSERFLPEEPVFRARADCGPTSGRAPLRVQFRTRGTFTEGAIVKYRWDFDGDGAFDVHRTVSDDLTHTFEHPGDYTSVLEITNNFGDTTTDSCEVTVQSKPVTPPSAEHPTIKVDLDIPDDSPSTWEPSKQINLTRHIPVRTNVSSSFQGFGPSRALDGDPTTSWFTSPGDAANLGEKPFYEIEFPFNVSISEIRIKGNHATPIRYDFIRGRVQLQGETGDVIDSWEVHFPEPWRDATLDVPVRDNVRRVRFIGLEDRSNKPGFGELTVLGRAPPTVARIHSTIGETVPVSLYIQDRSGETVRTLVSDETRAAGKYRDIWAGRNERGQTVSSGVYYAILEYRYEGKIHKLDLSYSTGGDRYNPERDKLPGVFRPFQDELLRVRFSIPSDRGASEVLAFVGRMEEGTRFVTLLDRVPFGVGTHSVFWDGFKPSGTFASPPPGESYLVGLFGFTLPDNAILIQSAPRLNNVTVEPNYFSPSTADFRTARKPRATVHYDLNKLADVELTVINLSTGKTLRRIVEHNVPGGQDHVIRWNGRARNGRFADRGDYRLRLRAVDTAGNVSLTRFALVRVFH